MRRIMGHDLWQCIRSHFIKGNDFHLA
jgi:hypothetical protein